MSNVVPEVERTDEEDVDARNFCNCINLLSVTSMKLLGDLLENGNALTFSKASFVSICTIVTSASFACCRYSVVVCPPNFSIGNGDPNPLDPLGGNFAESTSFFASSAVYRRGTMIPWAPESSAPVNPYN